MRLVEDSLESGYTYLSLLFFVFLIGMGLAVAGNWWHMEVKREREQELLFVGDQFRKAIESYHATAAGTPQFPKSLDDLVEDSRLPMPIRHLRRIYRDPMTGNADWELIKVGDRIIGVHSRSKDAPVKIAGFPERYAEFSSATSYSDWNFVYRVSTAPEPGKPPLPNTSPPISPGSTTIPSARN